MVDELTPLNAALEPLAQLAPDDGNNWDSYAMISAAISLKRIADALPGVNFEILDSWAQTIAWNAGRSFEAGRRQ